MARPRKKNAEKRTERLPHLRCTKGELATISGKAAQAGMTLSDYMRTMALDGEVVVRESTTDFALYDQLRRIGVNINQITRRMHQSGTEVPKDLAGAWKKLEMILDHIVL